jgi:hypothetical protein
MRFRLLSLLAAFLLVLPLLAAAPSTADASSRFSDGHRTVHTEAIEAIAQVGVAGGYPDGTYRPSQPVSRDQMATFIRRALQLAERSHRFADVDASSVHSGAIGAISHAGITQGCARDRYCPRDEVTRAQMATFLMRALDLPDDPGRSFDDVDPDDVHAPGIRAVAAAGITLGCGDGSGYCPGSAVQRDQMAAFLERALELEGPVPCPDISGSAQVSDLGPAVPPQDGYLTTAAVRAGDALEVLSNEQPTSRSARVRDSEITATATIPGERTWAHEVVGGTVYVGQWNVPSGRETLYSFPARSSTGDRRATAVADVPTGGEFWDLTSDDQGRLYAGTRAHNVSSFRSQIGLRNDEHVVHRITPGTGSVEHVRFRIPGGPPRDGENRRPDVKQLAWVDDTLYVGLGQQREGARLYALTDLDADGGPEVADITPESLLPSRAVFSLDVTDDVIAVGTQVSSDEGARVIALDRHDPAEVLADVELEVDGESDDRVDQVRVDDRRVVAGSFPSGGLHQINLDTGGARLLDVPVSNTPTRFLEVGDEQITGVSGTGLIWTVHDPNGLTSDPVDIAALDGAPLAPGRAHSLAVTSRHIVSGSSNIVHLRSRTSPSRSRSVSIGGEVKAMAVGDGRLFAAVYPNGELWEIDEDTFEAERLHDWANDYGRPRDATYHRRGSIREVLVVARDDDTGEGGLLVLRPDGGGTTAATRIRNHNGAHDEALAVAAHGDLAFVGTRNGSVRAVDLTTRRESWVARPASARVQSLEVVGGRIIGVAQTNSNGNGRTWFELDPRNGELLRGGRGDMALGHGDSGDGALLGPVSIMAKGRAVVAVQRGSDRATTLFEHAASGTFGGPYLAAADDCTLHVIANRHVQRLPYDPRTRLD